MIKPKTNPFDPYVSEAMFTMVSQEEKRVMEAARSVGDTADDPIVVILPEYKIETVSIDDNRFELVAVKTKNLIRYEVPRELLRYWEERNVA